MLPNGKAQTATDPFPFGIDLTRGVEELVGNVVARQVRFASAVMSVIADEDQIGFLEAIHALQFVHDVADQLVGSGNRLPSGSELAAAVLVADRVSLGHPDNRHGTLFGEQAVDRKVGVGIVDILPRFVRLEIGQEASHAACPQQRRHVGHHGQNAGTPVTSIAAQIFVNGRYVTGLLFVPLLASGISLHQPDRRLLGLMDRFFHTVRAQVLRTVARSQRFQER